MNTPICDFVREYEKKHTLRLHMPGHKGEELLGPEKYDITEIDGADVLYRANGIIAESQKNASVLFGSKKTLYSTEGSSLCIRAMLFLVKAYAVKNGRGAVIAAGRNAHKVFMTAAALLDIDVRWLKGNSREILSCEITAEYLDRYLQSADEKPAAVYITSPDYLGNISDIKGLAEVCGRHSVLLIVDNAHGAYLNFLDENKHPLHLGAHMCCDSAHKTLPALTGGAYLHIGENAPVFFSENAENALSMFSSTSPSYLILQSLDKVNGFLYDGYRQALSEFAEAVAQLKRRLAEKGYYLSGTEPLKITIKTKPYGYTGEEFSNILKEKNAVCEFYDKDYCVLMLSVQHGKDGLSALEEILCSIPKRDEITDLPPEIPESTKGMSMKDALFAACVYLPVGECEGKILASPCVSCPPAVPVAVCGDIISKATIECFKYYNIDTLWVVK
ncbi:MAG: amino acid decarboxylase [Clostridia bacterium]|nr:amino acid decarboxylase [Clostridia bacterium]